MKILEIVAGYPDLNGGKASSFIHTRNLYYIQHGITPIVLNFRTDTDYVIDGVQVICLKTFHEKYTKGGGTLPFLQATPPMCGSITAFYSSMKRCFRISYSFFTGTRCCVSMSVTQNRMIICGNAQCRVHGCRMYMTVLN